MLENGMSQVSIQIEAPGLDPFPLVPTPPSFSELIYAISEHLSTDPAAVRLTYTDPVSHQRLMLVGDQRYVQALKGAKGGKLPVTVVLVPVIEVSSPSGHIEQRRSKKHPAFEEMGEAVKHSPRSDVEALKRRFRSILENSQHFLSQRFKEALATLMSTLALPDNELDLSGSQIGAYESVLVAEVLQLVPCIRRVKLATNKLGNDGLVTICQGLVHLPEVEVLDLSSNQITSKGAHTLASTLKKLPKLQLLLIAGNRLKGEDVDSILDAAPSMCRVVYDKKSECSLM